MPGPYFEDQIPSDCGHYYPDVLRLRDEQRPDGVYVRILDCTLCGQYEVPLDLASLEEGMRRELITRGMVGGTPESKLAGVRKRELKRIMLETTKR